MSFVNFNLRKNKKKKKEEENPIQSVEIFFYFYNELLQVHFSLFIIIIDIFFYFIKIVNISYQSIYFFIFLILKRVSSKLKEKVFN